MGRLKDVENHELVRRLSAATTIIAESLQETAMKGQSARDKSSEYADCSHQLHDAAQKHSSTRGRYTPCHRQHAQIGSGKTAALPCRRDTDIGQKRLDFQPKASMHGVVPTMTQRTAPAGNRTRGLGG